MKSVIKYCEECSNPFQQHWAGCPRREKHLNRRIYEKTWLPQIHTYTLLHYATASTVLQHRFDAIRNFERRLCLCLDVLDRHTLGKLDECEARGEVDVEDALGRVSK